MNWLNTIISRSVHAMNTLPLGHAKMLVRSFCQAANAVVMWNCQITTKRPINVMSLVSEIHCFRFHVFELNFECDNDDSTSTQQVQLVRVQPVTYFPYLKIASRISMRCANAKKDTQVGRMVNATVYTPEVHVPRASFWSIRPHAWKIRVAKVVYIFPMKKPAIALGHRVLASTIKWWYSILLFDHRLMVFHIMASAVALELSNLWIRNVNPKRLSRRIHVNRHLEWLKSMAAALSYTLVVLAQKVYGLSQSKFSNVMINVGCIARAGLATRNMKNPAV